MKIDVLLGLQWGDEGKGKLIDVLAPDYDVIARFQGGPNAGHTLEFDGIKHVLHTIPSGIFRENKLNIIGNGVVIDPIIFKKESDALLQLGVDIRKKLWISRKAHLILPTHRLLDAASEAMKGKTKIGSTLKGIGPAYMDKTGRNGLRVGDIERADFNDALHTLIKKHAELLSFYNHPGVTNEELNIWLESIHALKQMTLIDGEYEINQLIKDGKRILAEGAQGSLLDIDFGSYPFVTSSNTITAGACTGLGVPPSAIGKVFGVFKAYCTRVGSGPFPTELHDETGEQMRKKGNEFGSTTGRARRCGWLDIPALNYACMLNGVTHLMMMKPDVLSGFDQLKVCNTYQINGKATNRMPYNVVNELPVPNYEVLDGWSDDITKVKAYDDLPVALKKYVLNIEQHTGIPVSMVSVGPDRTQTLIKPQ
jgi:adenylosuccinate synthase